MAKVLGLGGVFFRSEDPGAFMRWYTEALGLDSEPGSTGRPFNLATMPPHAYLQWTPFPRESQYFPGVLMFNFVVDDVDAVVARAVAHGALAQDAPVDIAGYGRFGWVQDPFGNKLEFWQPSVSPNADTARFLAAQSGASWPGDR